MSVAMLVFSIIVITLGHAQNYEKFFEADNGVLVFVNKEVTYHEAVEICRNTYHGHLAHLTTKMLASFMALPDYDSLWIGARSDGPSKNLNWIDGDWKIKPISSEIQKLIINKDYVDGHDISIEKKHKLSQGKENGKTIPNENCLAIVTKHRNVPRVLPISCMKKKPFLCEHQVPKSRPPRSTEPDESTHKSWIIFGDREYKIYGTRRTRDEAAEKCKEINSTLAVMEDSVAAKNLARYLLIGRPSLESAWIDAVYDSSITGTKACLIIDRHMADIVHYVEAPCNRPRAYICHRRVLNDSRRSLKTKIDDNRSSKGKKLKVKKHLG